MTWELVYIFWNHKLYSIIFLLRKSSYFKNLHVVPKDVMCHLIRANIYDFDIGVFA